MRIIAESHFSSSLPVWERDDVVLAADYVLNALEPLSSSPTRFHRYREVLASDIVIRPTDIGARRTISDAYASTIQAYLACTTFDRRPIKRETAIRLIGGRAGGNGLPDSSPWDNQFEVFCMAMLQFAGLHECRYAEPDLVIPAGEEEIGIAIKRVTADGNNAITKRIRQAQRQLERNQLRGCIVIEAACPCLDFGVDVSSFLTRMGRDLGADLERRDTERRTLALILVRFQPGWGPTSRLSILSHTLVLRTPDDQGSTMVKWLGDRGQAIVREIARAHALLRSK